MPHCVKRSKQLQNARPDAFKAPGFLLLGHPLTDKKFGYRVIEPTGDTVVDSAAYSAWVSASPRPPLFLSPTGQKFIISTVPAVVSSGDFRIEGNGVEMVHKFSTQPFLNVQRTMTAPQDAVSASVGSGVADVDFDISGTGIATLVTRVRLTNPANVVSYPPGSFVELSSEDVAPHGSVTLEFPRMGQVLRVARTSNDGTDGYIYFATTAWRSELYTNDIRVTLMPVGDTIVNNVRFSIEAASGEDIELRTFGVLWLQNCLSPRVTNCEIIESASTGLAATRCVGGEFSYNRISKVRFTAEPDGAPSNGRSGYGVFMSACDSFAVRGNFFTNVRHGVTDNWTNASAAGVVHRHGPNMNCIVDANVVAFPKGAGLDCHSSSIGMHMTGNTVIGARSDSTVQGCGYQIRGEGNILQGNADYDCEVGVQVFENTADGTQDALVIDHVSRAKKLGLLFAGDSGSTRKLNANIIGGIFETKQVGAAAGQMIRGERAKVNFRGTILRPHGQNGGNLVTVVGSGNMDISGEVIYDASAAAGAWSLLSTTGTGNTFALKVRRDADDGAGADAAMVVTDLSPDYILFATTLTADRAVTFSCTGRKRVTIYRTASGAFNLNVTHSGGVLALVADRGAVFEVFGALVTLVSVIPAGSVGVAATATGAIVAIIEDQKVSGTAGGTFTAGGDRTRVLNTIVYNRDSTVSLATNQFTLPAGSWEISWSAPANSCAQHQSFLFDVTGSIEVKRGTSEVAGGGTFTQTISIGSCQVTLVASNVYEIRHRSVSTIPTDGFGSAAGFGTEVYARVIVRSA